jgi:hypothetical protein
MLPTQQADRLLRYTSAIAAGAPEYDGYEEPGQRRNNEEAVRRSAAASVRDAVRSLAGAQRSLVGAGDLGRAAEIERLITRARHLVDRLESAPRGFAAWFGAKELTVDARCALASRDRELQEAARELADTARAGAHNDRSNPRSGGPQLDLDLLWETADELRRVADLRNRVFTDDAAPLRPPGPHELDMSLGECVQLEGATRCVIRRSYWPAGDVALEIANDDGRLVLWESSEGELIAFEAQPLEIDVPARPTARFAAPDDEYTLERHDAGSLRERDAFGRRRREAERWLYRGHGGAWLWVEDGEAERLTMRGTRVDPADISIE